MITCKTCGAQAADDVEGPDDPAPGICPPCFRDGMERIDELVTTGRIQDPGQMLQALSSIGMTSSAALAAVHQIFGF